MQKVKEIFTGHDEHKDATSSTGNRASREYADSGLTGNGAQNYSGDRLTGDKSGVTGNSSAFGSNTSDRNANSGVAGAAASKLNPHDHSRDTMPDQTSKTGGITGSTTGLTNNRDSASRTGISQSATGSDGLSGKRVSDSSVAGTGSSITGDTSRNSAFSGKHDHGHEHSLASKFDPSAETTHHDHKHLQHVTQRDVKHVETEEVVRQREHERNIHHVQHHVQPIVDKQVQDEVHHENQVPVTTIREQHVNTEDDVNLLRGIGEKHRDTETHRPTERTIVDRGEIVNENVHHHVHHVTQPVVQQEVVDRHRIHTTIPIKQVTHEAPIIHKTSTHEPIHMSDFQKGGGVLGSGITMDKSNVLQTGDCSREVDGTAETLAQKLHLSSGNSNSHSGTTGQTGLSGLQTGPGATVGTNSTSSH